MSTTRTPHTYNTRSRSRQIDPMSARESSYLSDASAEDDTGETVNDRYPSTTTNLPEWQGEETTSDIEYDINLNPMLQENPTQDSSASMEERNDEYEQHNNTDTTISDTDFDNTDAIANDALLEDNVNLHSENEELLKTVTTYQQIIQQQEEAARKREEEQNKRFQQQQLLIQQLQQQMQSQQQQLQQQQHNMKQQQEETDRLLATQLQEKEQLQQEKKKLQEEKKKNQQPTDGEKADGRITAAPSTQNNNVNMTSQPKTARKTKIVMGDDGFSKVIRDTSAQRKPQDIPPQSSKTEQKEKGKTMGAFAAFIDQDIDIPEPTQQHSNPNAVTNDPDTATAALEKALKEQLHASERQIHQSTALLRSVEQTGTTPKNRPNEHTTSKQSQNNPTHTIPTFKSTTSKLQQKKTGLIKPQPPTYTQQQLPKMPTIPTNTQTTSTTSADMIQQFMLQIAQQNQIFQQQQLAMQQQQQQHQQEMQRQQHQYQQDMMQLMQTSSERSAKRELNETINSTGKNPFPKLKTTKVEDFDKWYEKVVAVMANPQWAKCFDAITNTPLKTTTDGVNDIESRLLYSHIKGSLQGSIEEELSNRREYIGKGLEFLERIKRLCRPALSAVTIQEKQAEIINPQMRKGETISAFSRRIRNLDRELQDNGYKHPRSLIRTSFLNALGPEFDELHRYIERNKPLPGTLTQFNTEDMTTLTQEAELWYEQETRRQDRYGKGQQHTTRKTHDTSKKENTSATNTTPSNTTQQKTNKSSGGQNPTTSTANNTASRPRGNVIRNKLTTWQQYIFNLMRRQELTEEKKKELANLIKQTYGMEKCLYHLTLHGTIGCVHLKALEQKAAGMLLDATNLPPLVMPPLPTEEEVKEARQEIKQAYAATGQQAPAVRAVTFDTPKQVRQSEDAHTDTKVENQTVGSAYRVITDQPHNNMVDQLFNTFGDSITVEDIDNNSDDSSNYMIASSHNVVATGRHTCQDTSNLTNHIKHQLQTWVVDSGANRHMSNNHSHFRHYTSWKDDNGKYQKSVRLGDGNTHLPVHGMGTIDITVKDHRIQLDNVLYVPDLDKSLFSPMEHSRYVGCTTLIDDEVTYVSFPQFVIEAVHGMEIEFYSENTRDTTTPVAYEQATAQLKIEQVSADLHNIARKTKLTKALNDLLVKAERHQPTTVRVKQIHPKSTTLKRATPGSIGFELYSTETVTIPVNDRKKLNTGIAIQIPKASVYGRIAPKSSLTTKYKLDVKAGVIDSDYRGEIKVVLSNNNNKSLTIPAGTNIAQLIFEQANLPEIEIVDELDPTIRGQGGFGSTNTNKDSIDFVSKLAVILDDQDELINTQQSNIISQVERQPENANTTPNSAKNHTHVIPPDTQAYNDTMNQQTALQTPKIIPSSSNKQQYLPVRSVDATPSTASTVQKMTVDELKHNVGHRNIDDLIKNLHRLALPTVKITNMDKEPVLDLGDVSTIDKTQANTTPVPLPPTFGDCIHMDIGFGSKTAIGGVKYCLFLVDRATRYKFIYALRNLKQDLLAAFIRLKADTGTFPKRFIADFDDKLIAGKVEKYIIDQGARVQAAPSGRQDKNGLCERNWRTLVRMARSWINSAQLSSKYWWFAIRRAAEVSNYLPVKVNKEITSPFELVHGRKPDYRTLFPMFSIAYIRRTRDAQIERTKMQAKSLRCIAVGRCLKSNGLTFYHPPSQQLISSIDYVLDTTLAAGPVFDIKYNGGIYFNSYSDLANEIRPPTFPPDAKVTFVDKETQQKMQATVLAIPRHMETIYTVQCTDTQEIRQIEEVELTAVPTETIPTNDKSATGLPTWIKHDACITLYLPSMEKPKHGRLLYDTDEQEWKFRPGRKETNPTIALPDLEAQCHRLINEKRLFDGHVRFTLVATARRSWIMSQMLSSEIARARHVSATDLEDMSSPLLSDHSKLSPKDKEIWDAAYGEEYGGLVSLPTWKTITHDEYLRLRPYVGTAIPTCAISTIKHDENGKPVRAKYRIIALGNLDPNPWRKTELQAPVLSQTESRLLTALAVHHNRVLKQGDCKQAFVQSTLPEDESYVLRPPAGCPKSEPNTYWLLLRTLYGLKRSPRHWYDKIKSILVSLGFRSLPNAPCLFVGTLIEGEPPLYLGLYVDDFVYFSVSRRVEKKFERELAKHTTVEFMGQVTHFLGVKYDWVHHPDGHVSVHLSQPAFVEQLLQTVNLHRPTVIAPTTPYRSGTPVDAIKDKEMTPSVKIAIEAIYRTVVGSLLWLSTSTRPDISAITSMLGRYQSSPNPSHLGAAKYVLRYLKGTYQKGIWYSSKRITILTDLMQQDIPHNKVVALSDANWGPQDSSTPSSSTTEQVRQDVSRSQSGYVIFFHGPISWNSHRNKITARSSCESEIYSVDECTKQIQYITHLFEDLGLKDKLGLPIPIYNDNTACVEWSHSLTNRNLRHIQMRDNAVREQVHKQHIQILHCDGKTNIADIFTKEDKDKEHYLKMRDCLVVDPEYPTQYNPRTSSEVSKEQQNCSDSVPMNRGVLAHYPLRENTSQSQISS